MMTIYILRKTYNIMYNIDVWYWLMEHIIVVLDLNGSISNFHYFY
jgi:hypothetical protein